MKYTEEEKKEIFKEERRRKKKRKFIISILENKDNFIKIFREHQNYLVVYKRKKSKNFKITKLYFHYRYLGKYTNYISLRNSKKINKFLENQKRR